MASDNKTLGRFELVGIPPAPRGIPQIEVSFDIDANGIVNVSAKDLATGKEQSIRITASSGLSQEEIDRLVKEAETHAEEDKRKKELVDARNAADALIYTTEKSMNEQGDKVDSSTRAEVEEAVKSLKQAMENEDTAEIKHLTEILTQTSHKLAASMYEQASQGGAQQGGAGPEHTGQPGSSGSDESDEDVVDAEYREVV
jgi:molecular chaperone DnaK